MRHARLCIFASRLDVFSLWEKVDASILERKIRQLRSRSAHAQARGDALVGSRATKCLAGLHATSLSYWYRTS